MKYIIATRGERWSVKKFISELSAKYLPFPCKKDGKDVPGMSFQVGVMPMQLWCINFPRDMEEQIKATLFHKGRHEADKKTLYSKLLAPIRKILKLKPIKMDIKEEMALPINRKWVQVLPIGKMEVGDVVDDKGLEHENL